MSKGRPLALFTLDEIIDLSNKAKKAVMDGTVIVSWGDSGTNVTKQIVMPAQEALDECFAELQRRDPATYGRPRRVMVSQAGVMHK